MLCAFVRMGTQRTAEAAQKAAQHSVALGRTEEQVEGEDLEQCEPVPGLATVCNSTRNDLLARAGLEPARLVGTAS